MSRLTLASARKNEVLMREARLELARKDFWSFCRLMFPKFYRNDRAYLKEMCQKLQAFMEQSEKHFLVINCPPRHGKSLTAQNLTAWLFGQNPSTKVMTCSYNERISGVFARTVRNMIATEKVDENLVYHDIFPWTRVKYGEAAAAMWSLEGGGQVSYLASSPAGTHTGFGANCIIVDDLLKSADEAYNENVLDDHWEFFNNTLLSRTEGQNWKLIVIQTRWAEGDLAGRVLRAFKDDTEVITFKALQDDGSMLCESVLSRKDYDLKVQEMNLDIVEANYNQKPLDVGGRLFGEFKEWEERPKFSQIFNQTDTADTGTDYLCSVSYGIYDNEAYILDLVFTDAPMEETEPATADLFQRSDVSEASIESNNGGRGFARNVERILKDRGYNRTVIQSVPQSKNKESRILASSAWVQNHIYMPSGWKQRFPEFYKQIMSYQRKGRNAHDDAPDVLAAIFEKVTSHSEPQIYTSTDLDADYLPGLTPFSI